MSTMASTAGTLVRSRLLRVLVAACYLVAAADFATTWLALSGQPAARETGLMASRAYAAGGYAGLFAADIGVIALLTGLAWIIHRKYRSNLAVAVLLGPYICAGLAAAVNNSAIAL